MFHILKRQFAAIALLSLTLFAAPFHDSRYLSKKKQEIFSLERQQNRLESERLRWQWLRPLDVGYSIQDNYNYSPHARTRSFSVGINQPIFHSGAIFQSIRFANLKERYTESEITLKETELVADVLRSLYTLQKLELQREKQKLIIANSEIEVTRKKEHFHAGIIDSGELDRAILERNSAELRLLEIEDSRYSISTHLASISDIDPHSGLALPKFRKMTENFYLKENLELERLRNNEKQLRAKYYETSALYLPQVSLQARYYYQHNHALYPLEDGYNEYHTLGISVSFPFFDLSRSATVQSAKIAQLKAGVMRSDALSAAKEFYSMQMRKLELLERRKTLNEIDLKLYDSLVQQSIERYDAGEVTEYDLNTMRNSKRIKELDLKIHELEEQLILLELYARIPRQ